jgi:hypothetical protein
MPFAASVQLQIEPDEGSVLAHPAAHAWIGQLLAARGVQLQRVVVYSAPAFAELALLVPDALATPHQLASLCDEIRLAVGLAEGENVVPALALAQPGADRLRFGGQGGRGRQCPCCFRHDGRHDWAFPHPC